jgi:hypothetical protein
MPTPLAVPLLSEGRQLGEQHINADRKPPSRYSSMISESPTPLPDSLALKTYERPQPSLTTPRSQAACSTYSPLSHPEDIATALGRPPLLKGELALPRRAICHSARAQKLMECLKISWGVQYELARGVLEEKWTWDNVTAQVLERLQGSNAEAAPRVHAVVSECKGEGGPSRRADSRATKVDIWWV